MDKGCLPHWYNRTLSGTTPAENEHEQSIKEAQTCKRNVTLRSNHPDARCPAKYIDKKEKNYIHVCLGTHIYL